MKISSDFFAKNNKKGFGIGSWNKLAKYVLLATALVVIYLIVKIIAKKILILYA